MAEGAIYHRDFWDVKQPGIYWFFQLGLALHLDVVGPRLLEIAGVLLGGLLVWRLACSWRVGPGARLLSPVLVLGSYLLLTHRAGVTQIEGLLNVWLVAVVALTWPSRPAGGPARSVLRWGAAGAVAGVVGLLKLVYLPLPAVLFAGALLVSRVPHRARLIRIAAAAAGCAAVLLGAVGYFAWNGALEHTWITSVTIPLETARELNVSKGWFRWKDLVVNPLLPLSVAALLTARRRGTVIREGTLAGMALLAVLLAWPQYPGQYRMLMLAAPVGLLAVVGADVVWRWTAREGRVRAVRRAIVLGTAVVLSLPMLWGPQRLFANRSEIPGWGLGEDARNSRDFVLLGQDHDRKVRDLRGRIAPGTAVYVFGHPHIYELLDVYPAISISGWDADAKPRRVWAELERELVAARPEWIYVEYEWSRYRSIIPERAPKVAAMLNTSYTVASSASHGAWYRTASPGRPCGIPCRNDLATAAVLG